MKRIKLFGFDVFVSIKKGIPKRTREEVLELYVHTCQVCFTLQHKLNSPKRRSIFAADDDYDSANSSYRQMANWFRRARKI